MRRTSGSLPPFRDNRRTQALKARHNQKRTAVLVALADLILQIRDAISGGKRDFGIFFSRFALKATHFLLHWYKTNIIVILDLPKTLEIVPSKFVYILDINYKLTTTYYSLTSARSAVAPSQLAISQHNPFVAASN
jgi:hypothetical protein